MSTSKDPLRIEIRIDRASVRRALVVGGSLVLLAVAGVSLAVPVTFSDGNVLTAQQLNDDFANLEQRVATVEGRLPAPAADGGVGASYVVRASLAIPMNAAGTPLDALCKAGEKVLTGSCYQSNQSSPLVFWKNEPILTGTNGWSCGADNPSSSAGTVYALAVCSP